VPGYPCTGLHPRLPARCRISSGPCHLSDPSAGPAQTLDKRILVRLQLCALACLRKHFLHVLLPTYLLHVRADDDLDPNLSLLRGHEPNFDFSGPVFRGACRG